MKDHLLNRLERPGSAVLKQQVLSYFLATLIFFQSATLFPNPHLHSQHQPLLSSMKNQQHSGVVTTPLPSQSLLPAPIEIYNHKVPLRIDSGSFSVAPGSYMYPFPIEENQSSTPRNVLQWKISNYFPVEGQDYILNTKIGHAIENLQDHQVMINHIYRLHNALVIQLQDIERQQGDNTKTYLENLIKGRKIPTARIGGLEGMAELTQVEEEFMIRVIHGPTEVAFYILDEKKFSEDSLHFKKLLGRQHINSGRNRLENQKGRHVIFLWRDGPSNTRTVVSPYIQKKPQKNQQVLPVFQDPQKLQQVQRLHIRLYDMFASLLGLSSSSPLRQAVREHRRLRVRDYQNALKKPLNWDSMSFGIAKSIFQGSLTFLLVSVQRPDLNAIYPACVVGFFSLMICAYASTYRYWVNMGGMGFIQSKEHSGWGKNIFQKIKDKEIDWMNTFKSRVVRTSIISLIQNWAFLYVTDPRAENITGLLDLFEFIVLTSGLSAINIFSSNVARAAWTQQAELNEQAGLTNDRKHIRIPFFPSMSWSHRNIDHLWTRYIPYDVGRIIHLLAPPIPILTPLMFSYGFDLNLIGVNSGLFAIGLIYLLGNIITLHNALKYHYEKLLDLKETRVYLDNLTKRKTGGLFLRINRMYAKSLSWFHSHRLPRGLRNQLKDVLLSEDDASIEDLHLGHNERERFERWKAHAQQKRMWDQEIDILHDRHVIDKTLANIENAFIHNLISSDKLLSNQVSLSIEENQLFSPVGRSLLSVDNLRHQITTSFSNFGKVLHAFSETLKAYYFHTPSSPVYQGRGLPETTNTDFYKQIWDRNANIERWDILVFFKNQVSKEFPHLKQALDIVTNDVQETISINVAKLQDVNILDALLEEFESFVTEQEEAILRYMEEQEIKLSRHKNGELLKHKEHSHTFNFDLENRLSVCIQALTSNKEH